MKYVLVLQREEGSLSPPFYYVGKSKFYYVGKATVLNMPNFAKERKRAVVFNNKKEATQAAKVIGGVYIEKV
jgi:hypothetical protein